MVRKGKRAEIKNKLRLFRFLPYYSYIMRKRESEKRNARRKLTFTRNNYPGLPNSKYHISLRELAIKIPHSEILTNILNINQMYKELKLLEINDLVSPMWDREHYKDNYAFSITTTGIISTIQYLGQFPKATEREDYIENVEKSESTNEVKDWFKGLKDKIKGKSQEEVAKLIVTGIKTYGLNIIPLVMNISNQGN